MPKTARRSKTRAKAKKLKVLFVSYEAAPFIKIGGLGDVAGSLPKALVDLGVDCRLILPLYKAIDRKKFALKQIKTGIRVPTVRGERRVNLWESKIPGSRVVTYFVEYRHYFDRKEVFGYDDDRKRFAFFGKAIIEIMRALNFEADVVHGNDWQTGLVPADIKKEAKEDPDFANTASVFTIHNLAYKGDASRSILDYAGLLLSDSRNIDEDLKDGDVDMIFQGIANADVVNTVSPTYAKEILTKEYGSGMESILRKRKSRLYGIINGIDYSVFDPMKDKDLAARFRLANVHKQKIKNKHALQKELGLPVKDVPVLSIVSRLVWQKGIDVFSEAMERIAKHDVQIVILGTGQKKLEQALERVAKKYPDKISANITFDVALAKRIYASSDFFYMPSRYEPCGLGQMIAMRYGTLLIARETGGLADTIPDMKNTSKGTGFLFKKFQASDLVKATERALKFYKNETSIEKAQKRAMRMNFTWDKSAKEYVKIYKTAIQNNKKDQRRGNHA